MTGSNFAGSSQVDDRKIMSMGVVSAIDMSDKQGIFLLPHSDSLRYDKMDTIPDTLCFQIPVIKERLTQARLYLYTDSLLKLTEQQVLVLQGQLKLVGEKEIDLRAMYESQIANLNKQIELYKDQITGYEKLVKLERRKRRLITFGGVLTTGTAIFLSLKK